MELSKDAKKMIAVFYKVYLERRKEGQSKNRAKTFDSDWTKEFPKDSPEDLYDTFNEIAKAFHIQRYIHGGFVLSDDAIVHMERRFPDGTTNVLSFLAQFIP